MSGECTWTMSYCPRCSTLRISRRRPSPMVMRACDPFAYTGWLRPRRMTFGCGSRARDVRRDDVDVVSAPTRFAGEEVDVLADAAEVRIVVLRDQRDAQRCARRATSGRVGRFGSAGRRCSAALLGRWIQERHVRRRGGRSGRGMGSTRRSRARSRDRTSRDRGSPPCSPQMPTFSCGRTLPTGRHGNSNQLPNPVLVKDLERIVRKDTALDVVRKEAAGIVSAQAESGLRQVVGAEGEELAPARRSRRP